MPTAPSGKRYRWGYFQGWFSLVFGALLALTEPHVAPYRGSGSSVHLALYTVAISQLILGFGLIRRKRYGLVLFYILAVLSASTVWIKPVPLAIYIFIACFWLIPAGFYYPKRWRDFGFGKQQEHPPQQLQPASTEGQTVGGIRLVSNDEFRRAVAEYKEPRNDSSAE